MTLKNTNNNFTALFFDVLFYDMEGGDIWTGQVGSTEDATLAKEMVT